MKYYIDTEFIEGFYEDRAGKERHSIDLISIGIVCENGRMYSAISNEYRYKDASAWVRKNVILPLFKKVKDYCPVFCAVQDFQYVMGYDNKEIARRIYKFIRECEGRSFGEGLGMSEISFYGYYSAYDWVVFCSLFGRMVDLPEGFPMYCNDIKEIFEDRNLGDGVYWLDGGTATLDQVKGHSQYPENLNEHSAIDDAFWNKRLHQFILDHMEPISECL